MSHRDFEKWTPSCQSKKVAHRSPEYETAVQLRRRILRLPLGLDFSKEDLDNEVSDMHYVGFLDGQLVAGAILSKINDEDVKMRQVFVDESQQRKGFGTELVKALENIAKEKGFKKMTMNARKTALKFYERLNYVIEGEEFLEVGIPHFKLFKRL